MSVTVQWTPPELSSPFSGCKFFVTWRLLLMEITQVLLCQRCTTYYHSCNMIRRDLGPIKIRKRKPGISAIRRMTDCCCRECVVSVRLCKYGFALQGSHADAKPRGPLAECVSRAQYSGTNTTWYVGPPHPGVQRPPFVQF